MEEDYYEGDYEDQLEEQEEMADVPSLRKKGDLYGLFQKTWKTQDSSKVANLSNQELGILNISVRDCQKIAALADTFHHPKFAKYFRDMSEITLKTSASKKGWFVELFVSQKKFTSKSSSQTMNLPEKKSKWSIYNKNKQQQQPQMVTQ